MLNGKILMTLCYRETVGRNNVEEIRPIDINVLTEEYNKYQHLVIYQWQMWSKKRRRIGKVY